MRTPLVSILALLSLLSAACGDDGARADAAPEAEPAPDAEPQPEPTPESEPSPWCEGATKQLYAPQEGVEIDIWPDAFYESADASSPTGVRLSVSETAMVQELQVTFQPIAEVVEGISGAATNSAFFARFDAPVGELPSVEASTTNDAWIFVDLSATPPSRVAFESTTMDGGATVVLKPLRPLKRAGRYGVIATNAALGADGACLSPSIATRDILEGKAAEPLSRLSGPWLEALDAVGVDPFEVSAMSTFTVQDEQVIYPAIAQTINEAVFEWAVREPCVDEELWRRCEMIFEALDFRDGDAIETPQSKGSHQVRVTVWLPKEPTEEVIPIVFGHGANTGRDLGAEVAEFLVPLGFALVASEALEHGDHPIKGNGGVDFLRFLGIDISKVQINGDKMRGNFNQSALEWVQLLQLVKTRPDLDGDGEPEWSTQKVGYFGISMGALIGSGVSALSDDVDAVLLSMGGGWLTRFLTEIEMIKGALSLLHPLAGGESRFNRLLIIAQTGIDDADPATWGARVFEDRILGNPAPHMLFPVTINDEIVPFPNGKTLAQALDLPLVGAELRRVEVSERLESPVRGNRGGLTAGYMQFDVVTMPGGGRESASHEDFPRSQEARLQVQRYFSTWRENGVPEIILPVVE